MTAAELRDLLKSRRYGSTREAELQAQIAQVFDEEGLEYEREAILYSAGRAVSESTFSYRSGERRQFLTRVEQKRNSLRGERGRSHGDRIDFLVGRIGLELKTDHAVAEVIRQLWRYATSDKLDELMLVTTRASHRNVPSAVAGKPLTLVYLCPL